MHTEQTFTALIAQIQRLGHDRETAGKFAVLIGDCHEMDEVGKVVVRDGRGEILARLSLDDGPA